MHKNDQRDAQAIAEAAVRPNIPSVSVKSQEQLDLQAIHRVRERLVKEKTAISNELRGILAESGIVLAQGHAALKNGIPRILEDAENGISDVLRYLVNDLMSQWYEQCERIARYDQQLTEITRSNDACKRLISIPGIGPINATLMLSHAGDARQFKTARHFAAYLGLVPRQHASGGKEKLLGITKRGNKHVRKQLVHGARSAYKSLQNNPGESRLGQWLQKIEGKHPNKVIVALANKLARIIWAVLNKETVYQA